MSQSKLSRAVEILYFRARNLSHANAIALFRSQICKFCCPFLDLFCLAQQKTVTCIFDAQF
jgi:hypothetical protein